MNDRLRHLARPWLLPFVPLYALAIHRKKRHFQAMPTRARSLAQPVISVGSISAGGAGKTPLVIALAQLLAADGHSVDVLSRGYGRRSSGPLRVDPDGTAGEFGDEPLLIARSTGSPVFVGANRYESGLLAERTAPSDLHLLDDGFQHRQLARRIDIVLLTRQDTTDTLLPAGNLREGIASLRRAHILVVQAAEAAFLTQYLRQQLGGPCRLWVTDRFLHIPQPPAHPLLFCGIARPHGLLRMLAEEGIVPVAFRQFHDHHGYSYHDIRNLVRQAKRSGAQSFLTTAKDAVKITPAMKAMLATVGPLVIAELRTEIRDADRCLGDIHTLLTRQISPA